MRSVQEKGCWGLKFSSPTDCSGYLSRLKRKGKYAGLCGKLAIIQRKAHSDDTHHPAGSLAWVAFGGKQELVFKIAYSGRADLGLQHAGRTAWACPSSTKLTGFLLLSCFVQTLSSDLPLELYRALAVAEHGRRGDVVVVLARRRGPFSTPCVPLCFDQYLGNYKRSYRVATLYIHECMVAAMSVCSSLKAAMRSLPCLTHPSRLFGQRSQACGCPSDSPS